MNFLVEDLVSEGVLKSPNITQAFLHTDRADFVPSIEKAHAYINEPLHIGYGQTISQPWTVAFMLEELSPSCGEKILDVGSGSGWQTALLSYIVSHDKTGAEVNKNKCGLVIGIEIIPELVTYSIENLLKYNYIKKGITKVHCLNAESGYEKEAPYDKIIAAAAGNEIPIQWKKQLKIGGKIVAPIQSRIVTIIKKGDTEFEETAREGFAFVPFINS